MAIRNGGIDLFQSRSGEQIARIDIPGVIDAALFQPNLLFLNGQGKLFSWSLQQKAVQAEREFSTNFGSNGHTVWGTLENRFHLCHPTNLKSYVQRGPSQNGCVSLDGEIAATINESGVNIWNRQGQIVQHAPLPDGPPLRCHFHPLGHLLVLVRERALDIYGWS